MTTDYDRICLKTVKTYRVSKMWISLQSFTDTEIKVYTR